MKTPGSLILIIENNPPLLATLQRILQSARYRLRTLSALADLRKSLPDKESPCCAIVDLDLPRGSGLAVQRFLGKTYPAMPVIFISSHASVPASVEVMKAGAFDLLVAPFNDHDLLKVIHKAVLQERHSQKERHELAEIRARLDTLTRRESEVLQCLLRGLLNKQTAAELGTCEKTIKVHRGRIMKKMQVQSIAQLVQVVMRSRHAPTPSSAKDLRG